MKIGTAIEKLVENYNYAVGKEWVQDKIAWALYHTWKEADRKTENCSEKPNNCEHITEDGVTCAKYPACDDCLDNPLNKVKGSERLLKGKDEPTISKMEQVDKDINVRSKWETPPKFEHKGIITTCVSVPACLLEIEDEPQKKRPIQCYECRAWRRCFKEKPPYNMIKSRCPIDEPQTDCPWK